MEDDGNRKNLMFMIFLLGMAVLIATFAIVYNVLTKNSNINLSKNKNTNTQPTEEAEENINSGDVSIVYMGYKVGDNVELADSTTWHVIYDSDENEKYVSILKDTPIGSIKKTEVDDYLDTTYKDNLINSIGSEISSVRLLGQADIENITGIKNLKVGTSFKDNFKWLYNSDTILAINDEDGNPVMICTEDDGSICVKENTDLYPVRPVIKVNKNYLK